MRFLALLVILAWPAFGGSKERIKALEARALQAELRAAVAEERLASIPHQQATERTVAAFHASCDAARIPVDKCEPDLSTFTVRAKPEPKKPDEKPKPQVP